MNLTAVHAIRKIKSHIHKPLGDKSFSPFGFCQSYQGFLKVLDFVFAFIFVFE